MSSRQSRQKPKGPAAKQGSNRNSAKRSTSSKKGKPAYGDVKQVDKAPLFDETAQRDIAAVVLIILAVVLFATAVLSPSGVVTGALSLALKYCFGIGTFVLPFLLVGIAITFLVRFDHDRVPARVAIGLGIIFVAFLAIVALTTEGAELKPNNLFIPVYLVYHGGYVGAGIAWACINLFGLTISYILMAGLIVLAIVIIGFSITSFIDKVRSKHAEYREASFEEAPAQSEGFSHMPHMSFARIRRANGAQAAEGVPGQDAQGFSGGVDTSKAATRALGKRSAVAQQKTQLFDEDGEEAPKKRSLRASHAAAPTMAFNADAAEDLTGKSAKPMTRKLGERPAAKTSDHDKPKPAKKKSGVVTPAPMEGFELPDMSLLNTSKGGRASKESEATLRNTAMLLQETLADFGVNAEVVGWVPGPTVTLFKVDLPAGVRVSRVSNLNDDIALALAAPGVRIFAPVPGTNYVGIEVPNKKRETVLLGDVLKDAPAGPLQIAIGKDVEGDSIVSDLATMPHLLIGGTTGSGKSVAINGMIMSILMRATPAEVRMIMIDPKRVEFTPYNGIPHLYVPVVTESKEAASALSWAVAEMERRLKVFSGMGARNIGQYNAKAQQAADDPESDLKEMPYLVIIIDELADLMMNVGKEVEFSISRLAQLARAAGIHLIVATQRPSTNVVTGLIKANITNRIAFNVASGIDSRVILDTPGAENLIGLGDLLLSKPELAKPQRIQGCYVSEDEISAVVEKLKSQGEPEYHNDILKTNLITLGDSAPDGSGGTAASADDPLIWDAAEIVCSSGMGSTSNLQRRLSVGYSRAGRLMDALEAKGIVGPPNGSKPREVLMDPIELETFKAMELQES